jgi:hypothetical protein
MTEPISQGSVSVDARFLAQDFDRGQDERSSIIRPYQLRIALMKQSVALPVKVPEPVLHLHFVSRSDCWSHRPGKLLTRLATRLCCRSIRLESCNHPTFRIRTVDRNRLVKHRLTAVMWITVRGS